MTHPFLAAMMDCGYTSLVPRSITCQYISIGEVLYTLFARLFYTYQWLEKLRLVDPPVHDSNGRVCSQHFTDNCFVSSVMERFGPARRTLKSKAVLTLFCFTSASKRRKLSKARESRAQQWRNCWLRALHL